MTVNPLNKGPDIQVHQQLQIKDNIIDTLPMTSAPSLVWQNNTGNAVQSVAMSSDGKYIAAGSGTTNNSVYLFNGSSSNRIWKYPAGGIVHSVAISSDGFYVVAGSEDNKVYLFNRTSGGTLEWSYTSPSSINSVDISSDGSYLVAGGDDKKVLFFERTSPTLLWNYATKGAITSVAMSSDGNYIAVGTSSKEIFLFDRTIAALKVPIWSINATNAINQVVISSDGSYIAAGSDDHRVYFCSRSSSIPLWSADANDAVLSVSISSSGNYIAAGTANNEVYLYEKSSSSELWSSDINNPVLSLAISSDGNYIVAGNENNRVLLFDRASSKEIYTYNAGAFVNSVAISDDGKHFVGGNNNNKIYYFSYSPTGLFTLASDADTPDTDGKCNLIWGSSIDADNYSIYTQTNSLTDVDNADLLVSGSNGQTYAITRYSSGDYFYIVKAVNKIGHSYSNVIQFSVRIPPGGFDLEVFADEPDTDGTVDFEWTESKGAQYYAMYIYDKEITKITDDMKILASGLTRLKYTAFSLPTGKYFVAILAQNATGQTLSNSVEFEVDLPEILDLLTPLTIALIIIGVLGVGFALFEFGLLRGHKKAFKGKGLDKVPKESTKKISRDTEMSPLIKSLDKDSVKNGK